METAPPQSPKRERIARKTRRQIWLQIYLPLGIGVLILTGLVIWVLVAGFGKVSAWADIGLVLILIPAFVVGLLILAALIGMTYGLFRLLDILPDPIYKVHSSVERVGEVMSRGADLVAWPMVTLLKVGAALKAFWRAIVSYL
jgi:hypothetical protein